MSGYALSRVWNGCILVLLSYPEARLVALARASDSSALSRGEHATLAAAGTTNRSG